MGAYMAFAVIGIPCIIFLIWCLTPSGKKWLKEKFILIIKTKKRRRNNMGAYMAFAVIGIPCIIFLIWCLTPSGKKWLKENHMI